MQSLFFESQPGSMRLKELIRTIRACRTAADERAVIAKESAGIRTAFKEEIGELRQRCVAKLLYIHMLGYPAHFGQIECLKLAASPHYTDKRLGYLGIMLLLDESHEVLTLVTNCLKNDMNSPNMYIVGLALCTLGNIASPEISRDLASEVERLLGSSNAYLRKKAGLCAVRIVRKVPESMEMFLGKVKTMLNEKNHAVLLTAVTLCVEMCEDKEFGKEMIIGLKGMVGSLIRHMKNLIQVGFSPEHDIGGVTDPFLQIKILHLFRLLAKGDHETSDFLNDILAQVATSTEGSKNVGNAILYEAVRTIMEIEADHSLRVLAINILGRFLVNKDNNIRYVALNMLMKTISFDHNAVQRHRTIIVECLKDADISIRRRALDLCFALMNESNIKTMTKELLTFLEVADNEFKPSMTTNISLGAEKYAPNKRWHFDTVLRVMKLAGNYVREEILSNFIRLISQSNELLPYIVRKLFITLQNEMSQESLTHSAVWCFGEYGDMLIQLPIGGALPHSGAEEYSAQISETEILDLLQKLLENPWSSAVTREYVLTALVKLSTRFDTHHSTRIKSLLAQYRQNINPEIQQCSVEYTNIFRYDDLRPGILERMPVPEVVSIPKQAPPTSQRQEAQTETLNLLDLDLSSDLSTNNPVSTLMGQATEIDLLNGLFGDASINSKTSSNNIASPISATISAAPFGTSSIVVENDTDDMFMLPVAQKPMVSFTAFHKNGLKIDFHCEKIPSGSGLNIHIDYLNQLSSSMDSFVFQAAVTKAFKLQMDPPTGNSIAPNDALHQNIKIMPLTEAPLKMRVRVLYSVDGNSISEQAELSQFPVL